MPVDSCLTTSPMVNPGEEVELISYSSFDIFLTTGGEGVASTAPEGGSTDPKAVPQLEQKFGGLREYSNLAPQD